MLSITDFIAQDEEKEALGLGGYHGITTIVTSALTMLKLISLSLRSWSLVMLLVATIVAIILLVNLTLSRCALGKVAVRISLLLLFCSADAWRKHILPKLPPRFPPPPTPHPWIALR